MKPILEIRGIGKKFQIKSANKPYLSLRESIFSFLSPASKQEDFWALKDVSFDVMPGDTIGIIGKNGAGKSTLLKILSKITPPTAGKITSRGRIASLLEVGTGFHPELSGKENIFLNGSILGMKRAEIQKQLDAIVDFSGVEKFLLTPLKHYSSGMQLRLAFAVAAFLEPEILIIDEVLAVGDAEFQKRCLNKMHAVSKSGRTILFVSHNMEALRFLCNKGVHLNQGQVMHTGPCEDVISAYLRNLSNEQQFSYKPEIATEENGFSLTEAFISSPSLSEVVLTNAASIDVHFRITNHSQKDFSVYMFLFKDETLAFISSDLHDPAKNKLDKEAKTFEVIFEIPKYILNPGNCRIGLLIADYNGNSEQYLNKMDVLNFNIEDDGYRRGGRYNLGWAGAVSPLLNVSVKSV